MHTGEPAGAARGTTGDGDGGDGLPTFLVIGAMKAGTSSLHRYLATHPEVGMSQPKETDFFARDDRWARGLDWYRSCFPDGDRPARGEASPNYTKRELHPEVAPRVAATLPDVRLVYLVRERVARLESHYRHVVATYGTAPPIDEVTRTYPGLTTPSLYGHQLEPWLERFGRDQLLVARAEDLDDDVDGTLARIEAFLGVAVGGCDRTAPRSHDSADKLVVPPRWQPVVADDRAPGRWLPTRVRGIVLDRVGRPASDVPSRLSDRMRAELAPRFAADQQRLEELLGDDAPRWS